MKNNLIAFLMLMLSFHPMQTQAVGQKNEGTTSSNTIEDKPVHEHIIESISEDGSSIQLDDGMAFTVNWWYRSIPIRWSAGDRIYISYDFFYSQFKLEDAALTEFVWCTLLKAPTDYLTIKSMPNHRGDKAYGRLILSNQLVFIALSERNFLANGWQIKNRVIIFGHPEGYMLWNIDQKSMIPSELIANRNNKSPLEINSEDILQLEQKLNQRVLQQKGATQATANSLLIYSSGLKDKKRPVGVFLFLGPTGVGKTELAKVLTQEIYGKESSLLRFDMSHFSDSYSSNRLIGSPPGYVNHEEGGQLTEPLLENPQMIVLLDEIEKAHSAVQKVFLPIFDEGFVLSNKNYLVDCTNVIFIMTSNLCGPEIAELFNQGYTEEEILQIIEPSLMKALSPELYNRVEPILFRPLQKECMEQLVNLHLQQLIERIWNEKQILLNIDESLIAFLIEKGFHPLLGARPLKKLIDKKVVGTLAYTFIKEGIEGGSTITLVYDEHNDAVMICR